MLHEHLAYWAQARREFEKALDNYKSRAEKALLMIQQLYAIERKAKQGNLSPKKTKELRGSTVCGNDLLFLNYLQKARGQSISVVKVN
ncbi:Transposase IS66 family protein [compost metagenome]